MMHEFGASITYDTSAPGSPAAGSATPFNAVIGQVKEFDGVLFAATPHTTASDSWPTLSTVITVDGKSVLRPFPAWDVSASDSVVAFDIDRKGRLYAVCRSSEGDELKIWHTQTAKLLHSTELPAPVAAIAVDDHGKSHTAITDDSSSTIFMLAATPASGENSRILMYTHQHSGDRIRAFKVPLGFDTGSENAKLAISISGDGHTCYISSPTQLWSFQTDGLKVGREGLRMYPVCGQASKNELRGLMYHPVARSLVFAQQGVLFKVNPLDAWSKSFEDQQIAVTDAQEVLPVINSLALDWKYDIIVTSSAKDGSQQKIQVLIQMQFLRNEQSEDRIAMDYSDL
jgi:hypothetical protein